MSVTSTKRARFVDYEKVEITGPDEDTDLDLTKWAVTCDSCGCQATPMTATKKYDMEGEEEAPSRYTIEREYHCTHCGASWRVERQVRW